MRLSTLTIILIGVILLSSGLYAAQVQFFDSLKAAPIRKYTLVVDWRRPAGGVIQSSAGPVLKGPYAYGQVGLTVDCPVVGDVARPTFNGSIPGPLIEVKEGELVEVTLINNIRCPVQSTLLATDRCYSSPTEQCYLNANSPIDRATTDVGFHAHGLVQVDQKSDGSTFGMMRFGGNVAASGKSHAYRFYAAPGSAGYYMYHDHAMRPRSVALDTHPNMFESDHIGMENGLYGPLIIRPQNYVRPEKPPRVIPLFMVGFNTFNNRVWASDIYSNAVVASYGEELEIIIANIGSHYHTFHLHSHHWRDPATGAAIDSKALVPGEIYGFRMVAGNMGGSGYPGPGTYMFHCHVNEHMMDGMWGEFIVLESAPLRG